MRILFNKRTNLQRRKELRKNMTPAEAIFWEHVRGSQIEHKIRRKHGISRFTVDFYCAPKRVAIEIDGGVHKDPESKEKDLARSKFLRSAGIRVIRINNDQVLNNIESVLLKLKKYLDGLPDQKFRPHRG